MVFSVPDNDPAIQQHKPYPALRGLPVDICVLTIAADQNDPPSGSVDKRTLKFYPERRVKVVLVQRTEQPNEHKWALPGGFTRLATESLDDAVKRELKEETNLDATTLL
ncbi:MAG: ADP-ribose pyrophosphatase, partial [Paenibacillus sp.]|nr:ADP-ribose pyrophosphatase [Paenibacillus sp.]